MDPTFVSDDDATNLSSSQSKNVAGQQFYASVFGDEEEEESFAPSTTVPAIDQNAFPASFEDPEPRKKAHSALEEEIFAKLANEYVEPSEKRGQPDNGEDHFAAKRAPTDFPADFSGNSPFETKASLSGEGEMNFADVFTQYSDQPAGFISPSLNESHSVGESTHDEKGGVHIRMRKHTSFEEDERLDLDAVLAAASMETVTRMEALMEPSCEAPKVETEQNDKTEERVSTPKPEVLNGLQGSVTAHPNFQSLQSEDVRPESDNASVFDLEAVLTGASTPPKDEKKTSNMNAATSGMVEHSVENNNEGPQSEANEPNKSLQSHASSDPYSKMIREPSEFDLARALGADEQEEVEPAGVPLSPSMFERSVDSKASANGAFGGGDEMTNRQSSSRRESNVDESERPKFLLRQSSSLFSDGQFSNDDIPRGVVVNQSDFGEDARPRPSDSNEPPTPPSTRQNSMAEGAYSTNAINEEELVRASLLAHERSENDTNKNDGALFPELEPSLERSNAQEFTQTDHLNRTLLMAAASSGIPSHFFEAARGGDDNETDGPLSDEESIDDDDYSPAMRAYLNQIRGQTGEEEEEQNNETQSGVDQSKEKSQAEEDELAAAGFAPGKLIRQLTSTSDFEISTSASPHPAPELLTSESVADSNDPFLHAEPVQEQPMEDPFASANQVGEDQKDAQVEEQRKTADLRQFTKQEEEDDEDFEFQQAEPQNTVQTQAPENFVDEQEEEGDDFGDFEEAGTSSVAVPSSAGFAAAQPQVVTLAPPPATPPAVVPPAAAVANEPPLDFVSNSPEPDLKSLMDLSSCTRCGGPVNFDLFSACPACGDTPKLASNSSSGRLSLNLSRSASSHQVVNGSEMVLNDLLSAIDFASCVEDPSALPIAALAASDNDNALRLLLGEDVIDTRRASLGHAQDVPSTSSSSSKVLGQQESQKKTDPDSGNSFFVV